MSIAFDSAWGVMKANKGPIKVKDIHPDWAHLADGSTVAADEPVRPPPPGAGEQFPIDSAKRALGEEIPGRKKWQKPGMLARIKNLAGFDTDTEYARTLARQQGESQPTGTGIQEEQFDTDTHINEIEGILEELSRRAAGKGKEFAPDEETQRFLDHIASVDPREVREDEDFSDAIGRLSGGYRSSGAGSGRGMYRSAATFKDEPEWVYKIPRNFGSRDGADVFDNAISMALERSGYPFVGERPVRGKSMHDTMLVRQPRAHAVQGFPDHLRSEMGSFNLNSEAGTQPVRSLVADRGTSAANEIRAQLENHPDNKGLLALLPRVDVLAPEPGEDFPTESQRVGERRLQNEKLEEILDPLDMSGANNPDSLSSKRVKGGLNRAQNIAQMMRANDLHSANMGIHDGKLKVIDPMFSGTHPKQFFELPDRRRRVMANVGDTRGKSKSSMGVGGLGGLMNMLYGSHGEQIMEAAGGLEDSDKGLREGWHVGRGKRDHKVDSTTLRRLLTRIRSPAMRYRVALQEALPYLEEGVRDELPAFAEGLPDRQFYQPWFDTLIDSMQKPVIDEESIKNRALNEGIDPTVSTDSGSFKAFREAQIKDILDENALNERGTYEDMRMLGTNVDKAIAYKRWLQLLASIMEDPQQKRLFEFANPTSEKFGEALREAATRPKVSMESALEQIDHEPLPRIGSGKSGEMATVVGADKLRTRYDEAIEGLKEVRGAMADDMNEVHYNDPNAPLSERSPEAHAEQVAPRVGERMVMIYNLLTNQYGEGVAKRWWEKYGGGSYIQTLGAEGYEPDKIPLPEDDPSRGLIGYGTGDLQDYGGVLSSHPAWQAVEEFLQDKKTGEEEVPKYNSIREAEKQVGNKALNAMLEHLKEKEGIPPEWEEQFEEMGGVRSRAGAIAEEKHDLAMMNAETEALQEMFRRLGRVPAQEEIDAWRAGGQIGGVPPFDAAGNLLDNAENAQMFNLPSFWNQDISNINWPPGVGMA